LTTYRKSVIINIEKEKERKKFLKSFSKKSEKGLDRFKKI